MAATVISPLEQWFGDVALSVPGAEADEPSLTVITTLREELDRLVEQAEDARIVVEFRTAARWG